MYEEQRYMLVDAFECDDCWRSRISSEISSDESIEKLVSTRELLQHEFSTTYHPTFFQYGMIWERMGDLDIDYMPFVKIESEVFQSVGTTVFFPNGISMLERIIRKFKRKAEETMSVRQFEYVFKVHLVYA